MMGWIPFGPPRKLGPKERSRLLAVGVAGLLVGGAVASLLLVRPAKPPPASWPHQPQIYPSAPDPRFSVGVPLRPMDADIFAALARGDYRREELLDLFPERPYLVKLIGSEDLRRIQIVAIALHRSGRWDERWLLKDGEVERRTMDAADPSGAITFVLRHGRWLPR